MNLNSSRQKISYFGRPVSGCARNVLISVALFLLPPLSMADFDYTHGKWELNPAETVDRRAKMKSLDAEEKDELAIEVKNAITYWELDGTNLTYTDNNGKVSKSPYEAVRVEGEKFEMVFVSNGRQIGGAIQIEPSESGFCATFMVDHSNATGLLSSHTDCYQPRRK
ncbi:MAG: hypothetical protein ACI8W1_001414 [Candidatus Azotimanducaceae bacterium]|jgi:hypothetical protein